MGELKVIGLLGGMSWESTVTYYQEVNRRVRQVKGGLHSARCIILSVDFAQVEQLQRESRWEEAGALLEDASVKLAQAGAESIVLCTNTMHFVSGGLEKASGLALIHIADPTAESILGAGHKCVALLGTSFTMKKSFYKDRLSQKHGLRVLVPEESERNAVHSIIYKELCNGIIKDESRKTFQQVISGLARQGAECVIMGCTEIGLLVDSESSELPLFDTAKIHAIAAADWSME